MQPLSVCPICGCDRRRDSVVVPDHEYGLSYRPTYVQCDACGCLYQSPMPDVTELASFYPEAYHSMHSGGAIASFKYRMRLTKLLKLMQPGDAFLDFGCGDGAFVRYAAERSPDRRFLGYEIDGRDSISTSHDGRAVIIRGSWQHLLAQLPPVKVISMHHVIEHLPDPKATLQGLRRALAPGGAIVGQTPATDSLERRLFGTRWSGFHAPRHTVVFSRAGLTRAFRDTDFAASSVRTGLNPAAYAVSLASLFHGPNGGVVRRSGPAWLALVALSALCAPADWLLGGSIVDFHAEAR
jgi:SAM-dependent methyltransferase